MTSRGSDLSERAYAEALRLLRAAAHPEGFVASPSFDHYRSIWARDAAITSLGANVSGDPDLLETSKRTLETLARLQAPHGQVPNAYWPDKSYWDWGETGAADGTAWFVIAAWHYYVCSKDRRLLEALLPSMRRAIGWLGQLDLDNSRLLSTVEAADWMDSTLNRSGKVFYVNVLYCLAASAMAKIDDAFDGGDWYAAEDLRERLNFLFWPSPEAHYGDLLRHVPYPASGPVPSLHTASAEGFRAAARDRSFYLAHITFGEFVNRCDVLANVLAILYGIAAPPRAESILAYLRKVTIDDPYPVRCWPFSDEDCNDGIRLRKLAAEQFQPERWHNPPYRYHNAAVWPFIGGFYVAALATLGHQEEAAEVLEHLAEANRLGADGEWRFHEWLDGRTGQPGGAPDQAWSAGAYVLAFRAVHGDPSSLSIPGAHRLL